MSDLISRQAAMEEISKQQTYKMFEGEDTLYLDANDVGSVLASLPSAHPEPCEDAVSRKLMYELGATCMARRDETGELVALGRLDMLPSAQPVDKDTNVPNNDFISRQAAINESGCWNAAVKMKSVRESHCNMWPMGLRSYHPYSQSRSGYRAVRGCQKRAGDILFPYLTEQGEKQQLHRISRDIKHGR